MDNQQKVESQQNVASSKLFPSPKVSIIIPAYNQAQYLAEAIRSALAQTYRNYEIIVVDDGSTDDTPQVAKQFNGQVHYLRQENQGLAGARNTGIRQARGEYIALLDSDDAWQPNYLQVMTDLAAQHPEASVFYCPVVYMDAKGHELPQPGNRQVLSPEEIYSTLLRANFLVPSTILMRRSVVMEAGLFDPAFRRLQDWDLWLRLLRDRHIFVGIGEPLVRYRLHTENLSSDPGGGQRAALAMMEKLFGPDDGQWWNWNGEKRRAYGGAYRYQALSSIQHQNNWRSGAQHLRKALQADPSLSTDINLYYELALGAQPLGFRGTAQRLDLEQNAENLKKALLEVFLPPLTPEMRRVRRRTIGTAYHALGLAAYYLGSGNLSRRNLLLALRFRPELVWNNQVLSVLAKSFIGRNRVYWLCQLRKVLSG
jgi:glycosyltransferase involved in cell wall biosynthesis